MYPPGSHSTQVEALDDDHIRAEEGLCTACSGERKRSIER